MFQLRTNFFNNRNSSRGVNDYAAFMRNAIQCVQSGFSVDDEACSDKNNCTHFTDTSAHDFSKLHGRTSNGEDLVGMDDKPMVGVSTSVNLPLLHKVQKFSSGTTSPGGPGKRALKRLWWCGYTEGNPHALKFYSVVLFSLMLLGEKTLAVFLQFWATVGDSSNLVAGRFATS